MSRTKSFSRSGAINIVFQILFLLILYLAGRNSHLAEEGFWKNAWLFLIILVPSAIWTVFFYLQDRIEPEPASYVLVSFIAGMAAASLVALPLEKTAFSISGWMYHTIALFSSSSIFIMGGIASFLIYLIIRYGFYGTKEFDEPADGMVYGAFAGSGFAFVKSFAYLAAHPDFTLFAIGYTASTNILVYASVASLIGYFIGKCKFSGQNIQIASVIAILLGMVLIGVYHILTEVIFLVGFDNAFWISLVVTVIFAVSILARVYLEMRKLTEKSLHQDIPVTLKPDFMVFILFIIILVVSGFTQNIARRGTELHNKKYGVTFHYPRYLSLIPETSTSERMVSLPITTQMIFNAGNLVKDYYITIKILNEVVNLSNYNPNDFIINMNAISIPGENVTVGKQKGIRLKYSYADTPRLEVAEFPRTIWAYTDIIPAGKFTLISTLTATPQNFDQARKVYQDILKSIQWDGN